MDLPKPPHRFITVYDAFTKSDEQQYDIMGVVTDFLPPGKTRGTDFTLKFHLWDPSCAENSALSFEGMTFRFFKKTEAELPSFERGGDVMLLRNVKTKNQGSSRFGISNYTTTWVIISGSDLLRSTCEQASDVGYRVYDNGSGLRTPGRGPKPDLSEIQFAKELVRLKEPNIMRVPPPSTSLNNPSQMNDSARTPGKQKYRMIKDLDKPANNGKYVFVDIFGEVRKLHDSGGSVIELKITDYTENLSLYDYVIGENRDGDEFGHIKQNNSWFGPWGQMTMQISVWDEHAAFVRKSVHEGNMRVGSYLLLQNTQIKFDRNGQYLEGVCRGGSRGGLTVYLPKEATNDFRFKELLRRKRQYEAQAQQSGLPFNHQSATQKEVNINKRNGQDENRVVNKSSNQKKKEKRRSEQRKAKEIVDQGIKPEDNMSKSDNSDRSFNATSNQNVRCEGIDVKLTTVADILSTSSLQRTTPKGNKLSLPFQNSKYRSRVVVYDFFPDNLEDFTFPVPITDFAALSDHEDEDEPTVSYSFARGHPACVTWTWHFYLLVGDPQAKLSDPNASLMLLQVSDQDADLLFNAEACDLRSNPGELAKIKEKLFVLWGDLQEKKEETGKSREELANDGIQISSRPFECFIKEYGVAARDEEREMIDDQYERMFRIFGTRIC